jgi:hypothetical protein
LFSRWIEGESLVLLNQDVSVIRAHETNKPSEVNDKSSMARPSRSQSTLNIVGVIVLVLGLGIASIVLVAGRSKATGDTDTSGDWHDDTLSVEDSKSSSRDLEMYDGKLGMLSLKLMEAFQQPESLAMIIAAGSTLFALACFYISRRVPPDPPVGADGFSS